MAVREKITKNIALSYFEGEIPMKYRYTMGLAGEKFFQEIKNGKLTASVANNSGTVYCPPRIFCEDSFEAIDEIIELTGEGTLESFTICFEDLHGDHQDPVIIALVRFDGADTATPVKMQSDLDEPFIGMRVVAKYVPKSKRTGSINDIFVVPVE
jgi:uncharacterized OB-fold protein